MSILKDISNTEKGLVGYLKDGEKILIKREYPWTDFFVMADLKKRKIADNGVLFSEYASLFNEKDAYSLRKGEKLIDKVKNLADRHSKYFTLGEPVYVGNAQAITYRVFSEISD